MPYLKGFPGLEIPEAPPLRLVNQAFYTHRQALWSRGVLWWPHSCRGNHSSGFDDPSTHAKPALRRCSQGQVEHKLPGLSYTLEMGSDINTPIPSQELGPRFLVPSWGEFCMRKHTGIPEQHFTQSWTRNSHKGVPSCYSLYPPKSLVITWESSGVIQPQDSETGDPEESPVCILRSKAPHEVNISGLETKGPWLFSDSLSKAQEQVSLSWSGSLTDSCQVVE